MEVVREVDRYPALCQLNTGVGGNITIRCHCLDIDGLAVLAHKTQLDAPLACFQLNTGWTPDAAEEVERGMDVAL